MLRMQIESKAKSKAHSNISISTAILMMPEMKIMQA